MKPRITFRQWLRRQERRNTAVGDLARDMRQDRTCPRNGTLESYTRYLQHEAACPAAFRTLQRAWRSYRAYLAREPAHAD